MKCRVPILKQRTSPHPCFPLLTFLSLVCFKERYVFSTASYPFTCLNSHQCAFCPNFYWNFSSHRWPTFTKCSPDSPWYFLPPYLPILEPPWQNMLMSSSPKSSALSYRPPYLTIPFKIVFSLSFLILYLSLGVSVFKHYLYAHDSQISIPDPVLFSNSWHTWPSAL